MTDALTKLKERIKTIKDDAEYDLMIKDYANERLKELEDYAKNEAELFKALITGGQHD